MLYVLYVWLSSGACVGLGMPAVGNLFVHVYVLVLACTCASVRVLVHLHEHTLRRTSIPWPIRLVLYLCVSVRVRMLARFEYDPEQTYGSTHGWMDRLMA